jgi:hypothetical protein
MIVVVLAAALRACLVLVAIYVLNRFHDILWFREKIGIGILAGSGFLTLPVILDFDKRGTPYDTWAGLAFSLGTLIFFWGFIDRKLGHERRNTAAIRAARRHLTARGKL